MNPFTFIILCLASYRITHLLVFDTIFYPIRNRFVIRYFEMDYSTRQYKAYFKLQGGRFRQFIGKILLCFWCAGVWSAIGITALYAVAPDITIWLMYILAIAAVQSLMEQGWTKAVGYPEAEPAGEGS